MAAVTLARFKKRPVVVEAVQYLPGGEKTFPMVQNHDGKPFVTTIHKQPAYVVYGDWLIREPDGVHFYPCKASIFQTSYEPVKEGEK